MQIVRSLESLQKPMVKFQKGAVDMKCIYSR